MSTSAKRCVQALGFQVEERSDPRPRDVRRTAKRAYRGLDRTTWRATWDNVLDDCLKIPAKISCTPAVRGVKLRT